MPRTINFDGRIIQVPDKFSEEDTSKFLAQFPDDRPARRLRESISFGAGYNPDQYANRLRLQSQTGLAPEVTEGKEQDIQKQADVDGIDYQHLVNAAPKLSSWASNPDNAAVSYDDIVNLAEIEQSTNSPSIAHLTASQRKAVLEERKRVYLYNKPRNEVYGAVGATNQGFYSPFVNFGANVVKLLDALGGTAKGAMDIATGTLPYEAGMKTIADEWRGNTGPNLGTKAQDAANYVNEKLGEGIKTGPQQYLVDAEGNRFENPDYRWYGRGLVTNVESVPGAIAGFMVGGQVNPRFMPGVMATNATADKYRQALAEGADIPTAMTEGVESGIINYGLMTALPAAVPRSTRWGTLTQAVARGATLGAGMTAGENLIARMHAPDKSLFEGLGPNMVSMIAFETAGSIPRMMEIAEQSKLVSRYKEKAADAFGQMLKGSNAENVLIPVDRFDVFFQSRGMNPEAMAEKLGILDKYAEAKSGVGGDDVTIPTAKLLTEVESKLQYELIPDIKLHPEDLTMRQQAETKQAVDKWMAEGGQEKLAADIAKADQEVTGSPDYQTVKAQFRQSYIDAGETPEVADSNATIQTNVLGNIARETGVKLTELASLYRPVKIAEDVPQGTSVPRNGEVIESAHDRETLFQVQDYAAPPESALLQDLSRRRNAGVSAEAQRLGGQPGGKAEAELPVNGKDGSTSRQDSAAGVRGLRESQGADASRGLLETVSSDLALSGVSREAAQQPSALPEITVALAEEMGGIEKRSGPVGDFRLNASTDGVNRIGYIDLADNGQGSLEVVYSHIEPELRGQGYGTQMYIEAAKFAKDIGATEIRADLLQFEGAKGVWRKLEALGLPIDKSGLTPKIDLLKWSPEQITEVSSFSENVKKFLAAKVQEDNNTGHERTDGNVQATESRGAATGDQGNADNGAARQPEAQGQREVRGTALTDEEVTQLFDKIFYQPAYHGSPYKFDKFTLEHIGKGEGAQAYGWGLYFAGNKSIAEHYREALTPNKYDVEGATFPRGRSGHAAIDTAQSIEMYLAYTKMGYDADFIRQQVERRIEYNTPFYADNRGSAAEDFNALVKYWNEYASKATPETIKETRGQLYQVDIPEDSTMLDWDKPLKDQPKAAQEAIRESLKSMGYLRANDNGPRVLTTAWKSFIYEKGGMADKDSGATVYQALADKMGGQEQASRYLHSLGISGIKYLDANSRTEGKGTHNYVVFDDNAIKILKTFYQASPSQVEQRGWFRMLPDGTFEIGKTKIGDLSTFVHEPAHSYLVLLSELTQREGASEAIKGDYQKILDFLGAKPGEALTTEQHEKWARANEQYLREGKAPSQSLKGVFQRFAVWLSSIYKSAKDLNVELSDDIRGVFDRLYAAEDGVNRAEQEAGPRLFTTPEEAGWTPEQFAAYAESRGIEAEQAKAEILSKLNEAAIRDRSQEWLAEQRNVRQAVTVEVDGRQDYTAMRSLRRGALDDGTELKLSREALIKQFGEDRVKALQKQHRGLYRTEGGVDAETAAEILGYESGEQMMQALETTPRRAQAIEQGTRDFMTAKHGDIRYDGTLDDQARLALENDKKAANLHKELEGLQKKVDTLTAAAKTAASLTIPPMEAFRTSAQQIVESKPLLDLQPNRYLDASRKASRESFDALKKGDLEAAKSSKQKELINHFLFREASKAKAEADKIFKSVGKYSSKTTREKIAKAGGEEGQHVYLDQIDNILEQFRFKNESIASIKAKRQSFEEFAAQKQAEAVAQFNALNPTWAADHPNGEVPEIPIPVDTAISGLSKNYRELNIGELRAVRDALKNIETLARKEYGVIIDGKLRSFDQEVADAERIARENRTAKTQPRSGTKLTAKERAISWIQGADAFMQKIEWLVDMLDGGDVNGPFRRNIKRVIDDARGARLALSDKVYTQLKVMDDARPKEDIYQEHESTGIQFPKSERPLDRAQLISWMLNLGTAENQKVALVGEGLVNGDGSLRPEFYKALNGTMRKSELEFIQGIWDIGEQILWPEIRKAELSFTGIEPKRKVVTPFDVTTVDGEVVHMKGGYYPLKGEPLDRVGRKQADPANLVTVGLQKPQTSTSHLHQVSGATYRLDLNYKAVLSRHLSDVITRTSMGEGIAQVYKFISDDRIRTTMQETLGEPYMKEFLLWLQDVANENRSDGRDHNFLINFLMNRRSGMVAARLGGNLSSYLVQFGDVFKSFADPDVKTKYLAKAFLDIRMNPSKVIEEIRSLSPNEMKYREKNFNRDIRDMLMERGPLDHKRAVVTDFLMQGFEVMDRFITFPAWLARYRQGMDEHGESARAAREADRTIARSYQAADPSNMSRMMRQQGLMRLLTTFQGDANTWYGLISSAAHSGNARTISVALMALIAEQVAAQLIKNRGPKKDENWAGWLGEQALLSAPTKIPLFGDIAQYGVSKITGQYANLNNPTIQIPETTVNDIATALKSDKDWQERSIAGFEAVGIWTGLPGTSQAVKTWKYIHNVQKGKEPKPENAYEAIRGAAQGSNRKR